MVKAKGLFIFRMVAYGIGFLGATMGWFNDWSLLYIFMLWVLLVLYDEALEKKDDE